MDFFKIDKISNFYQYPQKKDKKKQTLSKKSKKEINNGFENLPIGKSEVSFDFKA